MFSLILEQRQGRHGTNRFLNHRRQTRWATFNMNELLMVHKCRCLELGLLRYNINILCIQESHMRDTGRVNFNKGHTLLYIMNLSFSRPDVSRMCIESGSP